MLIMQDLYGISYGGKYGAYQHLQKYNISGGVSCTMSSQWQKLFIEGSSGYIVGTVSFVGNIKNIPFTYYFNVV